VAVVSTILGQGLIFGNVSLFEYGGLVWLFFSPRCADLRRTNPNGEFWFRVRGLLCRGPAVDSPPHPMDSSSGRVKAYGETGQTGVGGNYSLLVAKGRVIACAASLHRLIAPAPLAVSLVRRPSGLEAFGRTARDTLAFILADASSAAGEWVRWMRCPVR
jgi:hypothetical protein